MEENTNTEKVIKTKVATHFRSLSEIADWQLDADNLDVDLPALQRGYVWKPNQVEKLWDSLLRGFPVGSFLVSQNDDPESTRDLYLLDGQQRATAIAMGYYNPWEKNKNPNFYSSNFKKETIEKTVPVLWLDIGNSNDEQKGESKDFIFLPRIVTQSHPWGYTKTGGLIGLYIRRKAIERYDDIAKMNSSDSRYTQYELKYVYPWDAAFPVPMSFLIEAITKHKKSWKIDLIDKCQTYLKHVYDHKKINLEKELNGVSEKIEVAIERLLSTQMPIIVLQKEQLAEESNTISNEDASTLFVRINTAGTPLQGEELIYSMYKTAFPSSKDLVEDAGAGFIAPSRIISLISRIVFSELIIEKNEPENVNIPKAINLKQFRDNIKKKDEFYSKLDTFIFGEEGHINIFQNVKRLLIGNRNYQLPFPLVVDIARSNQDILFVLLFWLYKTELTIDDILEDEKLHKQILATITIIAWFSIDTNKIINSLSKNKFFKEGKVEFWNGESFKRLIDANDNAIINLPSPRNFRRIILSKFGEEWQNLKYTEHWEDIEDANKLTIKTSFLKFKDKLFKEKGLLLFVQRDYINSKFQHLQWDTLLEDTSRPYDWDHVYPSVYNQQGTNFEIRDINNSIGNLRAWALEDNRSDQDGLPKDKLANDEIIEKSFIKENDLKFWIEIESGRITENDQNKKKAENVCNATYTRIGNIYKEWYDTLCIVELFE